MARQNQEENVIHPVVEPAPPVEPAPVAGMPPADVSVIAEHNEPLAEAHTDQDAPETTRHDATDMGVPMLPGTGNEPQGPEDALGPGPKRGDYTDRIGPANYRPHEVTRDADGKVVVVDQLERVGDIGDAPGLKGGVTTANL